MSLWHFWSETLNNLLQPKENSNMEKVNQVNALIRDKLKIYVLLEAVQCLIIP